MREIFISIAVIFITYLCIQKQMLKKIWVFLQIHILKRGPKMHDIFVAALKNGDLETVKFFVESNYFYARKKFPHKEYIADTITTRGYFNLIRYFVKKEISIYEFYFNVFHIIIRKGNLREFKFLLKNIKTIQTYNHEFQTAGDPGLNGEITDHFIHSNNFMLTTQINHCVLTDEEYEEHNVSFYVHYNGNKDPLFWKIHGEKLKKYRKFLEKDLRKIDEKISDFTRYRRYKHVFKLFKKKGIISQNYIK